MGDHAGRRYAARFFNFICEVLPSFLSFSSSSFSSDCNLPIRHIDIRQPGTLAGAIGQTARHTDTPGPGSRLTHPKLHPSHNAGPRASLRSSQHLRPARTPVRIRIRAGSSVASEAPLAVCIPQSAHVMAKIAFPSAGEHARSPPSSPRPRVHRRPGYSAYLWRAMPASCLSAPSWSDSPPSTPLLGPGPAPLWRCCCTEHTPLRLDNEGKGVGPPSPCTRRLRSRSGRTRARANTRRRRSRARRKRHRATSTASTR